MQANETVSGLRHQAAQSSKLLSLQTALGALFSRAKLALPQGVPRGAQGIRTKEGQFPLDRWDTASRFWKMSS